VSTKAPLIPSDWKVETPKKGSGKERDHQQETDKRKKRASAASSAVIFSAGIVLIR